MYLSRSLLVPALFAANAFAGLSDREVNREVSRESFADRSGQTSLDPPSDSRLLLVDVEAKRATLGDGAATHFGKNEGTQVKPSADELLRQALDEEYPRSEQDHYRGNTVSMQLPTIAYLAAGVIYGNILNTGPTTMAELGIPRLATAIANKDAAEVQRILETRVLTSVRNIEKHGNVLEQLLKTGIDMPLARRAEAALREVACPMGCKILRLGAKLMLVDAIAKTRILVGTDRDVSVLPFGEMRRLGKATLKTAQRLNYED